MQPGEYRLFYCTTKIGDVMDHHDQAKGWWSCPGFMGLLPDTSKCRMCMRRECRERFPPYRLKRKPLVSDPGMHHGTCVTHVPWCMSGSLTRGGGKPAHAQPAILRIWQEAHGCAEHDLGQVGQVLNLPHTCTKFGPFCPIPFFHFPAFPVPCGDMLQKDTPSTAEAGSYLSRIYPNVDSKTIWM